MPYADLNQSPLSTSRFSHLRGGGFVQQGLPAAGRIGLLRHGCAAADKR